MPEAHPYDDGWTKRPPRGEAQRLYRLRRCPTKGQLSVVILSHDLIGRHTHYYAGRTRPCLGLQCEPCGKNQAPAWHGYVACIDLKTNERLVVEVTSGVASKIGEQFDIYRTLRGVRMLLERTSPRANGRISARFAPPAAGTGTLPEAPDLRPIMERLWEVHSLATLEKEIERIEKPRPTGTEGKASFGTHGHELD